MSRPRVSRPPGREALQPPQDPPAPPRVRRRQKTARVAVRTGTTLLEFSPPAQEIPGVTKRKRPIR